MALDWESGALAEGLRCYRAGEYFEAHEHWESVWLASREPDKKFLQALIQVTAAFHHLGRGNRVGAASLLAGALRRLDPYPAEYGGVAVRALRDDLRAWRDAIEAGKAEPLMDVPVIL